MMSVLPSPARGKVIPTDTPHSVIMSLPEWDDNIALATGKLGDLLETTYPRFVLHTFVKQVHLYTPLSFGPYCLFDSA